MPIAAIAPKEATMLTPTVVEIRRGCARGATPGKAPSPTPPRS
jgi:hypothetical protein